MADFHSRVLQARSLRDLALEERQEQAERTMTTYAAYEAMAHADWGRIILDDLALVLLKPCLTDEEEGERRLVLKIFQTIREASQRLAAKEAAG